MRKRKIEQKGGKGKKFWSRNRKLVELRLANPKLSFALLGKAFGIDKSTAEDIFKRDKVNYKENDVDRNYNSIHRYNLRKNGLAKKCQNLNCSGESKRYEWALKHGKEHSRDIENYFQLCHRCHHYYDVQGIEPRIEA